MTRRKKLAVEFAILALKGAKEDLQAAIAELYSARPLDPTIPQIDSLVQQTQQVVGVLQDRLKRGAMAS